MSGGRFLVSLREVLNSDRILSCRSLIKGIFISGKKILTVMVKNPPDSINDLFDEIADEIMEVVLDDDAEKFLQPHQAMLPKSSSNEAPATYVSKPWHQKKLTFKTIPI